MRQTARWQTDGFWLASILTALTALAGCSSSPSNGGMGGAAGGKGGAAGGTATDAGTDHTTGAGGTGAGGRADAGSDTGTMVDARDGSAGDTGTTDAPADAPADVPTDTGTDLGATDVREAGPDTSGPCVTSFGAGNTVLYAFNLGANEGWKTFVNNDGSNTLTTSLGASYSEGHSCPGSLQVGANFVAYQPPAQHNESASAELYYTASPNGRNWSAYRSLHAWIKVQTADVLGLNGVYFYVKSGGGAKYTSAFAASADLADWTELVVDLVDPGSGFNGIIPTDVQQFGFEVALNQTPPTGAPATPSPAILYVDDVWLEAKPPSDGGTGDAASDGASGQ
jgi:hypothetical protein